MKGRWGNIWDCYARHWAGRKLESLYAQSSVCVTDSGEVEYARRGRGLPVLVLHGAFGGFDQSLLIADLLGEAGFEFLAVSRPGYLRTPISAGKSPDEQADTMAALLDRMQIPEAAVIGVSAGGPIALSLACRYPQRCAALVLVGAVTKRLPMPEMRRSRSLLNSGLADTGAWVFDHLARNYPGFFARRALTRSEVPLLVAPEPRRAFDQYLAVLTPLSPRRDGILNDHVQVVALPPDVAGAVRCPTLIIHGAADTVVPRSHALAAHEAIPGSELVLLKDGSHLAPLVRAGELRGPISEFLRSTARQAA